MSKLTDTQAQLLEFRRTLELSQEELAERLGVAVRTISRWESGHSTPRKVYWRLLMKLKLRHEEGSLTEPIVLKEAVPKPVRSGHRLLFQEMLIDVHRVVEEHHLSPRHVQEVLRATIGGLRRWQSMTGDDLPWSLLHTWLPSKETRTLLRTGTLPERRHKPKKPQTASTAAVSATTGPAIIQDEPEKP